MAHLGQYAPLIIVVANGACRQGAPLLTLCEVVPSQRGGVQNSNGAPRPTCGISVVYLVIAHLCLHAALPSLRPRPIPHLI